VIVVELTVAEVEFILQSLPRPFVYELEDKKSSGHKHALFWKALDAKLSTALTRGRQEKLKLGKRAPKGEGGADVTMAGCARLSPVDYMQCEWAYREKCPEKLQVLCKRLSDERRRRSAQQKTGREVTTL
jgi:hypothetical protein